MRYYHDDFQDLMIIISEVCLIKNNYFIHDWKQISDILFEKIGDTYLDQRASYFENEVLKSVYNQEILKKFDISHCQKDECNGCPINKYCNRFIKNEREKIKQNSNYIVDLFCGAGGLSLGFKQVGFVTSMACDIDPDCIETYAHNHPETPREYILNEDIDFILEEINQKLLNNNIAVVIGGPPCQGFSMANRQRLIDDPRNKLYKSFIKAVQIIKPTFVVMENVKGMLSVADQVLEDFQSVGYNAEFKVLNASNYGVPQNRERLIFIANNIGSDNGRIFDKITYKKQFVLDDALFGLRELRAFDIKNATNVEKYESGRKIEKNQCIVSNEYLDLINEDKIFNVVYNHKARYNNLRDIEIFSRLSPGDKSDDPKIADIMPYANRNHIFKDKYFKLDGKKLCKTITAHMKYDCNMYIHPKQARGLTPREAARVQSYPDDYYFKGAFTKTFMQIGNSVPPILSKEIAIAIMNELKRSVNEL